MWIIKFIKAGFLNFDFLFFLCLVHLCESNLTSNWLLAHIQAVNYHSFIGSNYPLILLLLSFFSIWLFFLLIVLQMKPHIVCYLFNSLISDWGYNLRKETEAFVAQSVCYRANYNCNNRYDACKNYCHCTDRSYWKWFIDIFLLTCIYQFSEIRGHLRQNRVVGVLDQGHETQLAGRRGAWVLCEVEAPVLALLQVSCQRRQEVVLDNQLEVALECAYFPIQSHFVGGKGGIPRTTVYGHLLSCGQAFQHVEPVFYRGQTRLLILKAHDVALSAQVDDFRRVLDHTREVCI